MAAPAHYIRTIHTSFTAAHPHSSSAWATHASSSSIARAHAHSNIVMNLTGGYNTPPASKYPPGLGATTGRKRSASIRVAPPAYAQRMQPQRVKFDPFAEEPESAVPLSSSVLYNTGHHPPASARSPTTRPASIPYTIQIPPAAPADIQKCRQQQQQSRQQQQVRVRQPSPPVQRVPTPAVAAAPNPTANAIKEREARSRIVAGILLNRVHAVGKPMRRRASSDQPRPYVPSGLSTCISIEA